MITFEDYRACLFNQTTVSCEQNTIRSKKHIVRSEKEKKIALSSHDDKRYITENNTDTLPWGYYDILDDEDLLFLEILLQEEGEEAMEVEEPVVRVVDGERKADEGLHKGCASGSHHSRSLVEPENGETPSKRIRL